MRAVCACVHACMDGGQRGVQACVATHVHIHACQHMHAGMLAWVHACVYQCVLDCAGLGPTMTVRMHPDQFIMHHRVHHATIKLVQIRVTSYLSGMICNIKNAFSSRCPSHPPCEELLPKLSMHCCSITGPKRNIINQNGVSCCCWHHTARCNGLLHPLVSDLWY